MKKFQKPKLQAVVMSKLEFRNSKFAGIKFQVGSKIDIQNFHNPNFELELNLELARDRNSKFAKPKFRAKFHFQA
jgi:hypothetical protein